MSRKNSSKKAVSGVIPYAKKPGLTSFSSLWSIKKALETEKVGHTGTLDSFADGLLVVLTGHLTHLVPHVTAFTKTYQAVICFGKATDTLDPCGEIIQTGPAPQKEQVEEALKKLTGPLLQVPPVYSSLHIDGKRASDMARSGKEVVLEPRQVFIYSSTLLDYREPSDKDSCSYALVEIVCSKGTYIRAYARDVAESLGSCAHLVALRRTRVGPFELSDAACYSQLEPFTIDYGISNAERFSLRQNEEKKERQKDSPETVADIKSHFLPFTPSLAKTCSLAVDFLKNEFSRQYNNGRPLSPKMFRKTENTGSQAGESDNIAVFYEDKAFAGVISKAGGKLSYSFVVPHEQNSALRIFSWEQLQNGEFPYDWKKRGTALSVGSFDGMHTGHGALLDKVLEYSHENDIPSGIVTFRSSYRNTSAGHPGDVATLSQKMEFCANKVIDFAIVIDFSDEFSKIDGADFISVLADKCSMRFMAEGSDFRCGYKGSFDMDRIKELSQQKGFVLHSVPDVMYLGQRVSSSRIRDCILHSDFGEAKEMLGHPYSVDCLNLLWTCAEQGWLKSSPFPEQVLPPSGTYSVDAVFVCGNKNGAEKTRISCMVLKDSIQVLLPPEAKDADGLPFAKIKSLDFI